MSRRPKHILLVTGMSGAGKSTVLRTLEDLGWETVDNLPLLLLNRLLDTAPAEGSDGDDDRPLALGIGSQTRGFDAESIVQRIKRLREDHGHNLGTLFLECAGSELERRYSETRRRHPLAQDRPAIDGIMRERELLAPLKQWSNRLIDTTDLSANELAQQIRTTFSVDGLGETTLSILSFGFSRGLPRNADLVLDMRFLKNPHWVE
ncbi:MAG: RNase adaptor protein RapZ, partial [Sphingomonadales bacterium]